MPDFEQTLRRDLSTAIAQQVDKLILNGNGTAPNPAGFLNAASGLTQPTSFPNQADGAAYFAVAITNLAAEIDGLYSHGLGDLHLLTGHETMTFLVHSFRSAETDVSILDYLQTRLGSLTASDQVPAPATNNQKAVVWKSGSGMRTAVAPIWQASNLIVDPYSKSSSGQVSLTMHTFFNFAVLRPDAYKIAGFRTKFGSN